MTNDRFKFRVWDKREDCYSGPPNQQPLLQANGLLAYFTEATAKAMDFYDIEFCTGLKDKNGKLIYEGDILKTLDGSVCFVIWSGTSFWLESPGSEAKDWEYNSFYEHCEVIGNIHENKELLDD